MPIEQKWIIFSNSDYPGTWQQQDDACFADASALETRLNVVHSGLGFQDWPRPDYPYTTAYRNDSADVTGQLPARGYSVEVTQAMSALTSEEMELVVLSRPADERYSPPKPYGDVVGV